MKIPSFWQLAFMAVIVMGVYALLKDQSNFEPVFNIIWELVRDVSGAFYDAGRDMWPIFKKELSV